MRSTAAIVFIILAVIGAAIGGLLDITGKDTFIGLSKAHFWSDSIFLLLLAVIALTWNCKESVDSQKKNEK